jgi:hypothetical protein
VIVGRTAISRVALVLVGAFVGSVAGGVAVAATRATKPTATFAACVDAKRIFHEAGSNGTCPAGEAPVSWPSQAARFAESSRVDGTTLEPDPSCTPNTWFFQGPFRLSEGQGTCTTAPPSDQWTLLNEATFNPTVYPTSAVVRARYLIVRLDDNATIEPVTVCARLFDLTTDTVVAKSDVCRSFDTAQSSEAQRVASRALTLNASEDAYYVQAKSSITPPASSDCSTCTGYLASATIRALW